jgi:hypothetical protein
MGYVLRYAGLAQESVREYEMALRLDPTNYILRSGAISIMQTGDYKRAHEYLRVDAGSEWARGTDAGILLRQDKYAEAADAYRHLSTPSRERLLLLACLTRRPHAEIEAEAVADEVRVFAIRDPEDRWAEAGNFAFCGLNERALEMLRLAVQGNYLCYPAMDHDPFFANIRNTSEFAAIRAVAIRKQEQFLVYRAKREHTIH